MDFISSKPVLIGLHLAFAIVGIDAFLWLLGEMIADAKKHARKLWAAWVGVFGFLLSWIFGGYYYVVFYGTEVKPTIKEGVAPWAHSIIMESKEHVFLFVVPLALATLSITLLDSQLLSKQEIRKPLKWLVGIVAALGLLIGAFGFIISAAARWGAI